MIGQVVPAPREVVVREADATLPDLEPLRVRSTAIGAPGHLLLS